MRRITEVYIATMADIDIGRIPFEEAIDAFRDKLSIPSNRWDDIFAEMNAKAFTVASLR